LHAMTTGPLYDHCDECTYIGTYPMRSREAWADVWLACNYSPEKYAVRYGKRDCHATNEAAEHVYAPLTDS